MMTKKMISSIPLNQVSLLGNEMKYIEQAVCSGRVSGDGPFTQKCHAFMEKLFSIRKVLLTTSGTHALEMAAILMRLRPGDEVILPSYTFVSTANAFVIHGAKPVFVDIRPDTLNLDESLIESKVTSRTRAIIPVHYAGVACEMNKIMAIAKKQGLCVVEDAAQAGFATYRGRYLGTIGDLGCFSFHETKNFVCGEGGALAINRKRFTKRAEIIREKGTNRSQYLRGQVSKYTWKDIGSSYLLSEILAAFLFAQLEVYKKIQKKRKMLFDRYTHSLKHLEKEGVLKSPIIPEECLGNSHIFYILLNNKKTRDALMHWLKKRGIQALFHFMPLHSSPMGKKYGYREGDFPVTMDVSRKILRLPLFYALTKKQQDYVIKNIYDFFEQGVQGEKR